MKMITAGCMCGGLLVGLICGTALAQNNPSGPPDQAGTANNIPTPTGTPGTFNSQTGKATSSQGKPGTPGSASTMSAPGSAGTPSAMAPGAPGTGAAPSR
jgi:hypothetical protein